MWPSCEIEARVHARLAAAIVPVQEHEAAHLPAPAALGARTTPPASAGPRATCAAARRRAAPRRPASSSGLGDCRSKRRPCPRCCAAAWGARWEALDRIRARSADAGELARPARLLDRDRHVREHRARDRGAALHRVFEGIERAFAVATGEQLLSVRNLHRVRLGLGGARCAGGCGAQRRRRARRPRLGQRRAHDGGLSRADGARTATPRTRPGSARTARAARKWRGPCATRGAAKRPARRSALSRGAGAGGGAGLGGLGGARSVIGPLTGGAVSLGHQLVDHHAFVVARQGHRARRAAARRAMPWSARPRARAPFGSACPDRDRARA